MELIVASVVTTIVLGGIFALTTSMQGGQNVFGQQNFLANTTQTMVKRILKDASEAVGYSTTPGIHLVSAITGVSPTEPPTFCFHKVIMTSPVVSTDKWVCYKQVGTELRVCDKLYNGNALNGAAGTCSSSEVFVGSVPAATLRVGNPSFVDNVFTIEIINRAGVNNPSYTARGDVVPAGNSTQ